MKDNASVTLPILRTAWDRYISTLETLRNEIETCYQYAEARTQRAMGFRHLMEVQAFAYNFALSPRTAYPRVIHNTCWQPDYYMIGGPGGDFDYRMIMVDARHTYRLTGKIN